MLTRFFSEDIYIIKKSYKAVVVLFTSESGEKFKNLSSFFNLSLIILVAFTTEASFAYSHEASEGSKGLIILMAIIVGHLSVIGSITAAVIPITFYLALFYYTSPILSIPENPSSCIPFISIAYLKFKIALDITKKYKIISFSNNKKNKIKIQVISKAIELFSFYYIIAIAREIGLTYSIPRNTIDYFMHILLYPLFDFLFLYSLNLRKDLNILLPIYKFFINFFLILRIYLFPLILYLSIEGILFTIKSSYPTITENILWGINNYTIFGSIFRITYMILIYIPSTIMYIFYFQKSRKYFL